MSRIHFYHLVLSLSWFCHCPAYLFAQASDSARAAPLVHIRQFSVEDGLPTNVLNCGMQDRDGFIWLGTREGLVRFDGKEFKTFTKGKNGLSKDNILRVVQINDDWLWLLTGRLSFDNNEGGNVNLLNTKTLQTFSLGDKYEAANGQLFNDIKPYCDTALILCSTTGYFFRFSPKNGLSKMDVKTTDPTNYLIDEQGIVWTADIRDERRASLLLQSFDFYGNSLEVFKLTRPGSSFIIVGFENDHRPVIMECPINEPRATVLKFLSDHTFSEFTSWLEISGLSLPPYSSYAYSATREGSNELWFRPGDRGFYLKKGEGAIQQVISPELCANIPPSDLRTSMFTDKSGKCWLATSEGLFSIKIGMDAFQKHLVSEDRAHQRQVRGICKDKYDNLYVAAGGSGEFKITKEGVVSKASGAENFVTSWCDTGRVLFGNSRIEQYHEAGQLEKFERLGLNGIWSIHHHTNGQWWFGGRGVISCNALAGPYQNLTMDIFGKVVDDLIVYQIFEQGDSLWFSTTKGLYWYYRPSGEQGRVIGYVSPLGQDLLADIHHVHRGKKYWWLCTNGEGLVKWNRTDDSFSRFTLADGLPSNVLYGALEDDFGFLWISSNYGLIQFNKAKDHAKTYTTADGLPHNEFNRISHYKDEDGRMYFGGLNGLVSFHPAYFAQPNAPYAAPLQVTEFYTYNEGNQKLENRTVDFYTNQAIELKPKNSFFNLRLELLDFENDKKRYAYKLEGLNEKWTYLQENELQLGNLPYGEYLLRIKGQNQSGQWSTSQLSIPLMVLTPIYLRWWFILLATALTALVIFALVRWRTWKLRHDRKLLRQQVAAQTKELSQSLQQKETLLKEVHHRVKNNLQIISSLLNFEQATDKDPHTKKLLNEARHRIKSMALIHQNLYQHDDLAQINMDDYLEELLRGLDKSFNKKPGAVNYSLNANHLVIDVDMAIPLGLIITELITNCYKYAFDLQPEGSIKVSLKKTDKGLQLKVADNGAGLPHELMELDTETLGLRLVHLLLKQLNGTYEVNAIGGTSFIFELPNPTT